MNYRLLKDLDRVRQDMLNNGNPKIANIIERAIEEITSLNRYTERLAQGKEDRPLNIFTEIE